MHWITPEDAWLLIAEAVVRLEPETTARRAALGRVLAQPLLAGTDVPQCDVSAMDGYAVPRPVRPGEELPVSGTVAAGDTPGFELGSEVAARIMTGAPAPATTHAVVPVEQTNAGSKSVKFSEESKPGAHIRRQGEVIRAGEPLLPEGTRLTPTALALLATHGIGQVEVYRRPTVATLATGDEVLPPESEPAPGQLRDSHTDFLLAAGKALGYSFEPLGIAKDDPVDLARYIRRGLDYDVLLISGGVSMGEYDFVEDILAEHKCETLFDAVGIQPGKPLVAARHKKGWAFGLPGNPASAMVGFWLFVKPLLDRLSGGDDGYWRGALAGTLAAELPGAKARDRFLTASVEIKNGELFVTPHPPKGSHDVLAYARGSALVRIPAHSEPAEKGASCEVLLQSGLNR